MFSMTKLNRKVWKHTWNKCLWFQNQKKQSTLSWLPCEWRKLGHAGQDVIHTYKPSGINSPSSPPQPWANPFPVKTNGRAEGKGRERKVPNASTCSNSFYVMKQALHFAEVTSLGQDQSGISTFSFCLCAFKVCNDQLKKQAWCKVVHHHSQMWKWEKL